MCAPVCAWSLECHSMYVEAGRILLLILPFHLVCSLILLAAVYARLSDLWTFRDSPVYPASWAFWLEMQATSPSWTLSDSEDLNLSPHTCTASIFPTEPSAQPRLLTEWWGLQAHTSRPDLCSAGEGTHGFVCARLIVSTICVLSDIWATPQLLGFLVFEFSVSFFVCLLFVLYAVPILSFQTFWFTCSERSVYWRV